MSWDVVGPVMRLNLEGTAKLVLVVYANEHNSSSESIGVAVGTAALIAGLSERTVQNYVKAFQADGVLIETNEVVGRGRARVWRINVERAARLYGRIPTYRERRQMAEKGESPAPFVNPRKGESGSIRGESGSIKGAPGAPNPIKDPIEDPARPAAAAGAEGASGDPRNNPALPPWSVPWQGVREFLTLLGWDAAKVDAWESDWYRFARAHLSLRWPEAKLVVWWALRQIHAEGAQAADFHDRLLAKIQHQNGGELLELAQAEAERVGATDMERAAG